MKFNNDTIREAVNEWFENEESAETKYGHISNWDVSNVTDMNRLFMDAHTFNQPLNNWDVSKVKNMYGMFLYTSSFNQPLNDWDVSNVTDMNSMFSDASSFNQPLNDWDVSNVTDMNWMFYNASSFNQPLNDWDVSSVTDMEDMFLNAKFFNQPLNNWDVSNVRNKESIFSSSESLNQPTGDWDVSNVTSMDYTFINKLNTAKKTIQFDKIDNINSEYFSLSIYLSSDCFEVEEYQANYNGYRVKFIVENYCEEPNLRGFDFQENFIQLISHTIKMGNLNKINQDNTYEFLGLMINIVGDEGGERRLKEDSIIWGDSNTPEEIKINFIETLTNEDNRIEDFLFNYDLNESKLIFDGIEGISINFEGESFSYYVK